MSADHDIDHWLRAEGYGSADARKTARSALEEAGLTRAGKQRFSAEKVDRVRTALHDRFALHCASSECEAEAKQSGRTPVLCDPKSACERCGGSANKAAEAALIAACQRHSVSKIVVVGGSPAVREELDKKLASALQLRLIDGTERRTSDRAHADLEWADLVLVWGASELHHKVSWLYTQSAPHLRKKVVLVARRGVAALLHEAITHLDKSRANSP